MPIREPKWWYDGRWPMVAASLSPAAALYGWGAKWRYRHGKGYRSRLPVICVGNLVAGGSGKTPFAMHLARLLAERGARPAFLSRGYGGRLRGPHVVDARRDTAADVGDEPLLLAAIAQTVIARDRAAGARLIERSAATHIIMDDGLQNPSLRKDLSFAIVDGERWIGNGRTIPAGPLRAPLTFQAGLVDALVVSRSGDAATAPLRVPPQVSAVLSAPAIAVTRHPQEPTDWLGERPWVAFAGIGRPGGFFAMLEGLGARLAARVSFADHHAFTPADARRLLAMAQARGAGLVTTAKDLVRLDSRDTDCARLKGEARALGLRLSMSPEDADRLGALLAPEATPAERRRR